MPAGRNGTCFCWNKCFTMPPPCGIKYQRCSHRLPLELSEAALEHPSMQILVGSRDTDLLEVAKHICKGEYVVVSSAFTCAECDYLMKELWREISWHLTQASLQHERGPAKLHSRSQRHSQGLEEEDQALEAKQQDRQSQSGRRRTCSRGRSGLRQWQSPSLHTQADSSPIPLALHNPILMSGSTTPWKASSCNTRTGHSNGMPPHRKKSNQGSRSGLRWMRSWVLNQTCLQTLPTFWLRGQPLSKRILLIWLLSHLHLPNPSVQPCPSRGSMA